MTSSLQKEKTGTTAEHVTTHDSIETQSCADSSAVSILRQVFRITGRSETAETLHLWVFDTSREGSPLALYAEKTVSSKDTQTVCSTRNDSTAGHKLSTKTTHEDRMSRGDRNVQLDEVVCTGNVPAHRSVLPVLLLLLLLLIIYVLYKLTQKIRQ